MDAENINLTMTCSACPEQYDAFHNGMLVGYLRLRHGCFFAAVPDAGGARVYEAAPDGDGIFDDEERDYYLKKAREAIAAHYKNIID